MMLWCLLQIKSQMSVLVFLWPKQQFKKSARESLCLFANIFDVENKTEKRRVGAAISERRAIKVGNSLCTNKIK